jgi:hypothetical protein
MVRQAGAVASSTTTRHCPHRQRSYLTRPPLVTWLDVVRHVCSCMAPSML